MPIRSPWQRIAAPARALFAVSLVLALLAVHESSVHLGGSARPRERHVGTPHPGGGLAALRATGRAVAGPARARAARPFERRHPAPAPAAPPPPPDPRARERDDFARDLAAAGNVEPARARALADLAVREARAHGLPPSLLLGVLLVENEPLDSRAVSSAGARGLMQVHPLWRPLLGPRHGFDLTADSTNLAFGAHILRDLLATARGVVDVEEGLLRYNGCRAGLRARRAKAGPGQPAGRPAPCAKYPARVRQRVERHAGTLCPSRSFARCVVRPVRMAAAQGWPTE
jgi:soluble lytic murein transglycosylase-like protein